MDHKDRDIVIFVAFLAPYFDSSTEKLANTAIIKIKILNIIEFTSYHYLYLN